MEFIKNNQCLKIRLKYELSLAIKCLGRIDEEFKALDYTGIDN